MTFGLESEGMWTMNDSTTRLGLRTPAFANAQELRAWLDNLSNEDLARLYEIETQDIAQAAYASSILEKAMAELEKDDDLRRNGF